MCGGDEVEDHDRLVVHELIVVSPWEEGNNCIRLDRWVSFYKVSLPSVGDKYLSSSMRIYCTFYGRGVGVSEI